jgi:hypothetical protein
MPAATFFCPSPIPPPGLIPLVAEGPGADKAGERSTEDPAEVHRGHWRQWERKNPPMQDHVHQYVQGMRIHPDAFR